MFGIKAGVKGKKVAKIVVSVLKIGDKMEEVTIPVGTTFEDCYKQAGIKIEKDIPHQLRKIVFVGKKRKTYKAKWEDKIKEESSHLVYAKNVKGGR